MPTEHRGGETPERAEMIEAVSAASVRRSQFHIQSIFLFAAVCWMFFTALAGLGFLGALCTLAFALLILAIVVRSWVPVESAETIEAGGGAPPRSQFDLKTIFLFTTAWSIFFGLLSVWGILGAVSTLVIALLILAVVVSARPGLSANQVLLGLMIAMGVGVPLAWPVVKSIDRGHPPSNRNACSNNLAQLAIGLQMYHDTYGVLPPAYVADERGRPMHSWRVLILPFMERHDLYQQYDFSEPWDGPNNINLVKQCPNVFRCPSEPRGVTTSYVAIVGPETIWPEAKACSFAEVSDGLGNTLLLAEVRDSGITWTEPRDLHTSQMAWSVNPEQGQGISSHHRGGAFGAFADRHVDCLPSDIPVETLRAFITRAGGEDMSLLDGR